MLNWNFQMGWKVGVKTEQNVLGVYRYFLHRTIYKEVHSVSFINLKARV